MTAYYNENDPKAAAWLRELIKARLIADGEVDVRSIEDVAPIDLHGFSQCHFFAGIGGWSYALGRANWPDGRPVWTGSCPCQPFSAAGKGGGFADERHLWPAWFHLIQQCRPAVLFGEQVSSKAGLGWFDVVQTDLENAGYAVGVADICAAGVGAPHVRQRLYFVADANGRVTSSQRQQRSGQYGQLAQDSDASSLEYSYGVRRDRRPRSTQETRRNIRLAIDGKTGSSLHMGNPNKQQLDGRGNNGTTGRREPANTSLWGNCEWIECTDGKARPVEPGTFPLAHGVSGRVGLLRGYGNAIVAPLAQAFIEAYMSA